MGYRIIADENVEPATRQYLDKLATMSNGSVTFRGLDWA